MRKKAGTGLEAPPDSAKSLRVSSAPPEGRVESPQPGALMADRLGKPRMAPRAERSPPSAHSAPGATEQAREAAGDTGRVEVGPPTCV